MKRMRLVISRCGLKSFDHLLVIGNSPTFNHSEKHSYTLVAF